MGHIKEPEGVDFFVDSTPLTGADRKKISEIIAHYKATGKKMPLQKSKIKLRMERKYSPLTKAAKRSSRSLANLK
jgi:hypothetical protein